MIELLILLSCIGLSYLLGYRIGIAKPKEEEGPKISTDLHCPACGNSGCDLVFDPKDTKVRRQCKTCGCTVTQPVVAPDLFKKEK